MRVNAMPSRRWRAARRVKTPGPRRRDQHEEEQEQEEEQRPRPRLRQKLPLVARHELDEEVDHRPAEDDRDEHEVVLRSSLVAEPEASEDGSPLHPYDSIQRSLADLQARDRRPAQVARLEG